MTFRSSAVCRRAREREKVESHSARRLRSLVADIFGGGGVNRVFRDIGGVIADPLEVARDEHQVQITAQSSTLSRAFRARPSSTSSRTYASTLSLNICIETSRIGSINSVRQGWMLA
jgi:hypothetical protein